MTTLLAALAFAAPSIEPVRWQPLVTADGGPGAKPGVRTLDFEGSLALWWKRHGQGPRPTDIDWTEERVVAISVGPVPERSDVRVASVEEREGKGEVTVVIRPPATSRRRSIELHPILLIRADRRIRSYRLTVQKEGERSGFRKVAEGSQGQGATPGMTVLDSAIALNGWWRIATRGTVPLPTAIDWKTERVIALAAGQRPSGGYAVEVLGIDPPKNGVSVVRARVRKPDGMATMALTYPYLLIAVPRGNVRYELKNVD